MQHFILQIPAILEKEQDVLGRNAGGGSDELYELFHTASVSLFVYL
jgi:hypothetical protein